MNDLQDWTTRLGVVGLALTAIFSVVGASVVIATGHDVPAGYYNIGSTAVGALAALLYTQHTPQATVKKGPGKDETTLKVQ